MTDDAVKAAAEEMREMHSDGRCACGFDDREDPGCVLARGLDAARAEAARYREALEVALAAIERRLGEDHPPGYYGPGSEWNQMVDACEVARAALDGEETP